MPPPPGAPAPAAQKRRPWLMYGGIAVVVAALIGGATWIVGAMGGSAWDSAAMMPADTGLYVNIDLDEAGDVDRLLDTFSGLTDQAGMDVSSRDELIDMIDDALMEGGGFDYTGDIEPWIGRTAGFGIVELDMEDETVELVATIGVEDGGAADAFMADNMETLAEESYVDLNEITIDGTLVYHLDDEYGMDMFVARVDEALVLASSRNAMERSMAAGRGAADSLADVPSFSNAVSAIPSNPLVYAYMDVEWMIGLVDQSIAASGDAAGLEETLGQIGIDLDDIVDEAAEAAIASVSITDAGLEFDMFVFGGPIADIEVRESPMLETLPASTAAFLMIGGDAEGGAVGDLRTALLDRLGPEIEQSLSEFEAMLGFDLFDDFLNLLSGDLAVVLTEDSGSQMGVGLALMLGLTDPGRVSQSIDSLVGILMAQGLPVDPGDPFYSLDLPDLGRVAFGVEGDRFYIASSESLVEDLEGGGPKLVDDDRFRAVRSALPSGPIALYADVPAILDILGAGDDVADALEPIEAVAVSTFTGNRSGIHVLVKIDWAQ